MNDGNDTEGNSIGRASATLEYLAKALTENPEAVKVEVADGDGDATLLLLHADKDDLGRLIGRRGHVIDSIRTVVRAIASRDGQTVEVDVAE